MRSRESNKVISVILIVDDKQYESGVCDVEIVSNSLDEYFERKNIKEGGEKEVRISSSISLEVTNKALYPNY